MSIVKINAIAVPEGMGPELEKRFKAREHAVDGFDGFEGFQLLRPTAGEDRYFVVTHWADEASYQAWKEAEFGDPKKAAAHGSGESAGHGAHGMDKEPVSKRADLLEFDVVLDVKGNA